MPLHVGGAFSCCFLAGIGQPSPFMTTKRVSNRVPHQHFATHVDPSFSPHKSEKPHSLLAWGRTVVPWTGTAKTTVPKTAQRCGNTGSPCLAIIRRWPSPPVSHQQEITVLVSSTRGGAAATNRREAAKPRSWVQKGVAVFRQACVGTKGERGCNRIDSVVNRVPANRQTPCAALFVAHAPTCAQLPCDVAPCTRFAPFPFRSHNLHATGIPRVTTLVAHVHPLARVPHHLEHAVSCRTNRAEKRAVQPGAGGGGVHCARRSVCKAGGMGQPSTHCGQDLSMLIDETAAADGTAVTPLEADSSATGPLQGQTQMRSWRSLLSVWSLR